MNKSLETYKKELEDAGFTIHNDQQIVFTDCLLDLEDGYKFAPSYSLHDAWEHNCSADTVREILQSYQSADARAMVDNHLNNVMATADLIKSDNALPLSTLKIVARRADLKYACSVQFFDFQLVVVIESKVQSDASMITSVPMPFEKFIELTGIDNLLDSDIVHQDWYKIEIKEMINQHNISHNDADLPSMFVITNRRKMEGAAVLADKEYLMQLHEELGDYFIIPSSVHEILILPDTDGYMSGFNLNETVESLAGMIQEVNDSRMPYKEVLSYRPYRFTANGLERL